MIPIITWTSRSPLSCHFFFSSRSHSSLIYGYFLIFALASPLSILRIKLWVIFERVNDTYGEPMVECSSNLSCSRIFSPNPNNTWLIPTKELFHKNLLRLKRCKYLPVFFLGTLHKPFEEKYLWLTPSGSRIWIHQYLRFPFETFDRPLAREVDSPHSTSNPYTPRTCNRSIHFLNTLTRILFFL